MSVTITSVEFRNFKAFSHFSISLQSLNILVGPNNCGKSTILGAFRALSAGIRRARAKGPELLMGPRGQVYGYGLSEDTLPISIENVHTDLADSATVVTFRLSNKNRLILYFPGDGGCSLIPETEGRDIRNAAMFKKAFPVTIAVVPVLGPVEHEEQIIKAETVQRNLITHRASRNFRNYWYHFPKGFEEFSQLVRDTWPGMDIKKPERVDWRSPKLAMFCLEKRLHRELYWSGFGFQVWCQLLTHISRAAHDTLLLVDEPEIYLHPDVQRQLLGILRQAGPDVLTATHSAEIIGEADPSEILLVDKSKQSAKRLRDVEGVQAVLNLVGSIQNITLTQLARDKRILFVEGNDDFMIIRRFARKMGFSELASGTGITPVESAGFSSWERVSAFAWGIEKTLGSPLRIAVVFDRDYKCSEEVCKITATLQADVEIAHIHDRKEIENYLLVPRVLERAVRQAMADRARRSGNIEVVLPPIPEILDSITSPIKSKVLGQYVARRSEFLAKSKADGATVAAETLEELTQKWDNLELRMHIVPGKEVLASFRNEIQKLVGTTLSDARIIEAFNENEIAPDLATFIQELEDYRKSETTSL